MTNKVLGASLNRPPSLKKQRSETYQLEGRHILLAEDNELNQLLVNDLLSDTGAVLEIVSNGIDAVEILKNRTFDCVLMDINMPKMDGYQASRLIRQQLHLTELPIIAMTAELAEDCMDKLRSVRINDHIPKPFKAIDFFTTLSKWLSLDTTGKPAQTENHISLTPIKGLNIEAGLHVCQGKEEFYLKLLRRFIELHKGFSSDFRKELAVNNTNAMGMLAHTLKGVAGNIGASKIHDSASKLNDACLSGHDASHIHMMLQIVEANLNEVLESLEDYFSGESHDEENYVEVIDKEILLPFMTDLYVLLLNNDMDARAPLNNIIELLKYTVYKDNLYDVIKHFENYRFNDAAQSLATMADRIDIHFPLASVHVSQT